MTALILFCPGVIGLVCLGAYIQRRVIRFRIKVWTEAQPSERKLAGTLMLYVVGDPAWSAKNRNLTKPLTWASTLPR